VPFPVWWLLLGLPLVASAVAWYGLCSHRQKAPKRIVTSLAMVFATSEGLLACTTLAYVELVKPIAAQNYSVESSGILLSLVGVVVGGIALRPPRWYSAVAFSVSAWMLVLFLMMGTTY
jgi:hypothetical protein